MGIDYTLYCNCCNQEVNIFSFNPSITYNHAKIYCMINDEAYEKLKKSTTPSELLENVLILAKSFPSTDRLSDEGDYYKPTLKNASIVLNTLLVWLYCNLRTYPKSQIFIWY